MPRKYRQRNNRALTCPEILAVIAILLVIVSFFLPDINSARGPSLRNSCTNNLKQIGLALLSYADEHGEFPPAYTVDAEGSRLHSWRTLILPYVEQQQLFDMIDLTKPWDDPVNVKARETSMSMYACPSSNVEDTMTTYLGVLGPDCFFSGAEPRKTTDITDRLENTITVIEVPNDQAVHWMSPHDVDKGTVLKMNTKSKMNHPNVAIAAFMDGYAKPIPVDLDKEFLRNMLTINGGEVVISEDF